MLVSGARFKGTWLTTSPESAECDASLFGWLTAGSGVVSTGSVVSATGAAFVRVWLATLPACAVSPIALLPAESAGSAASPRPDAELPSV